MEDRQTLQRVLLAPHCIKIDVDGSEFQILRSMNRLLDSPDQPRTIQVEINKRTETEIRYFIKAHNYGFTYKLYSFALRERMQRE